jgi:hypothetical protein
MDSTQLPLARRAAEEKWEDGTACPPVMRPSNFPNNTAAAWDDFSVSGSMHSASLFRDELRCTNTPDVVF